MFEEAAVTNCGGAATGSWGFPVMKTISGREESGNGVPQILHLSNHGYSGLRLGGLYLWNQVTEEHTKFQPKLQGVISVD